MRNRAFKQRYPRKRCSTQSPQPIVWSKSVAFPAFALSTEHLERIGDLVNLNICYQLLMATDAVFLNCICASILNPDYLRFTTQGKNCCMPQAILCLKVILVKNIIVWYMTVVAIGVHPMRAMRPC